MCVYIYTRIHIYTYYTHIYIILVKTFCTSLLHIHGSQDTSLKGQVYFSHFKKLFFLDNVRSSVDFSFQFLKFKKCCENVLIDSWDLLALDGLAYGWEPNMDSYQILLRRLLQYWGVETCCPSFLMPGVLIGDGSYAETQFNDDVSDPVIKILNHTSPRCFHFGFPCK